MKKIIYTILCCLVFGLSYAAVVKYQEVAVGSIVKAQEVAIGSVVDIEEVDTGCTGTYGTTSCATGIDVSENTAYLTQITIDCVNTAGDVCARLLDADDTTHEVLFAIYDDNAADDGGTAGEPFTRLWVSPSNVYDAGSASTYYDVCDAFTGLSLESGDYWVGFIAENVETLYERVASGGTGRYKAIGSFTLPVEWDHAGDSTSSLDRAIYLSF